MVAAAAFRKSRRVVWLLRELNGRLLMILCTSWRITGGMIGHGTVPLLISTDIQVQVKQCGPRECRQEASFRSVYATNYEVHLRMPTRARRASIDHSAVLAVPNVPVAFPLQKRGKNGFTLYPRPFGERAGQAVQECASHSLSHFRDSTIGEWKGNSDWTCVAGTADSSHPTCHATSRKRPWQCTIAPSERHGLGSRSLTTRTRTLCHGPRYSRHLVPQTRTHWHRCVTAFVRDRPGAQAAARSHIGSRRACRSSVVDRTGSGHRTSEGGREAGTAAAGNDPPLRSAVGCDCRLSADSQRGALVGGQSQQILCSRWA